MEYDIRMSAIKSTSISFPFLCDSKAKEERRKEKRGRERFPILRPRQMRRDGHYLLLVKVIHPSINPSAARCGAGLSCCGGCDVMRWTRRIHPCSHSLPSIGAGAGPGGGEYIDAEFPPPNETLLIITSMQHAFVGNASTTKLEPHTEREREEGSSYLPTYLGS
ncbi:hypothetical protein VTN77DRAFT_3136 [Rasamsonia byssochlamydoides]|uniref:uncharacterized protein n=1 Tax=Rasamsonia byssochlamydoides TaxID=89139 RepID=UPI003743C81B